MNKLVWTSAAVISLIVSAMIKFNSASVAGFLIGSLILGGILFGVSISIIMMIQKIKQKKIDKAIQFGLLSLPLIMILLIYFSVFEVCFTAITPAHFRTNVLTGQCNFGGYAPCVASDPWYYKPGCDVPDEEKTEVFKKTEWYDVAIEECSKLCEDMRNPDEAYMDLPTKRFHSFEEYKDILESRYCRDEISYVGKDISCTDLFPCDAISCD